MEKLFVPYELTLKLKELEEVWKDIKGYENIYQVSNKGNVRSLNYKRKKNVIKVLKPAVSNKGYYMLSLCKGGKQKSYCIHRLVAETFLEDKNPSGRRTVNHKDGNKLNNYLSNLEWCSYSENNKHSYRVLGKISGMKHKTGKENTNSIPVLLEATLTNEKLKFDSMTEAAIYLNVSVSALTLAVKEKRPCKKYKILKLC